MSHSPGPLPFQSQQSVISSFTYYSISYIAIATNSIKFVMLRNYFTNFANKRII